MDCNLERGPCVSNAMTRHIPLTASLLLACQATPPPEAPPAPPAPVEASQAVPSPASPPPSFDGADIALSDALTDAVATLGAQGRITSAKVGEGGEASESYAAYENVVAIATPDEERALLHHTDPIVRGYLGGHLARFHPGHLHELSPLLRDITPVEEQQGCMRSRGTVASYVTMILCDAVHLGDATASEARGVLTDLAGDATSPVQDEAKQCLDGLPS